MTTNCSVCNRNSERMNSEVAECSHIQCPHRRSAWSDRPQASELFKGPWVRNADGDPIPVDVVISSSEGNQNGE